jgi:hypothetical protein
LRAATHARSASPETRWSTSGRRTRTATRHSPRSTFVLSDGEPRWPTRIRPVGDRNPRPRPGDRPAAAHGTRTSAATGRGVTRSSSRASAR